MLYKKNGEQDLSKKLFQNPTSEYRGTPFWSWNCKLEKKELLWQIEQLKEMGFGGFHMHVRDGMATTYLSDDFMDLISACVDKAKQENMLAWLYDEDRWPSGSAGGLITKNPEYRQRKLVFTPNYKENHVSFEESKKTGKPYLLSAYSIELNADGTLKNYSVCKSDDKENLWYAYIETPQPSGWYNNQCYVDTLSKEAIQKFVETTHEHYKKTVGSEFDKTIPAIFTDEPQFAKKQTLPFATSMQPVEIPWTMDFPDTFQEKYGYSILTYLPEIFWELPEGNVSQARYHYHDHITDRFTNAFAKTCGDWCRENHISLTGHMMEEPTLQSQTAMLGEAMRAYPHFDLPGIDMLCNRVELTTAKQAQSAAHQYGKEGVLSELYGVTNWNFDFRGHKFQGDWQAALGVTVRVPHLSWVSMKGQAKRDYPASINYQSPWYKEYKYIEDHFSRVHTAMTRGKPIVKLGVIHPIESFWLHYGPNENTSEMKQHLDTRFQSVTDWLLKGLIDFDYICESLLPSQYTESKKNLKVGKMEYETVLVPGCETLRQTTIDILNQFLDQGGTVIFAGEAPKYTDGKASKAGEKLYARSLHIPFEKVPLLSALEDMRTLRILNADGTNTKNLIYQMRQDTNCKWLFIAHAEEQLPGISNNIAQKQSVQIKIKGLYTPELYNTLNGNIQKIPFEAKNGYTIIPFDIYAQDSILLRLNSSEEAEIKFESAYEILKTTDIKGAVPYTLSEPNVLLLNMAEYALDDQPFRKTEEILRLDSLMRKELGYQNDRVQPYIIPDVPAEHTLTLRFTINSEIEITGAKLAMEDTAQAEIHFNGQKLSNQTDGWFTDKSIETLSLPIIQKGSNILEIKIPFGPRTRTEWCYILGSFGVRLCGTKKTLVPLYDKIGFASITNQGLPFYSGNITYLTEMHLDKRSDIIIHANHYQGALIRVFVDEQDAGVIAFSPYDIRVNGLAEGTHKISYTLYGNRFNSFGALHNSNSQNKWAGPDAWFSNNDMWSYTPQLRDMGILSSPIIKIIK